MHHCKRYRSPEPDPYLSYRWKRRRSYSREHEGRLRYPRPHLDWCPHSPLVSHDRLPYQRRYRERRDSDTYRCEERSPSLGRTAMILHVLVIGGGSRDRGPYRTRKSCSSASSVSGGQSVLAGAKGLISF
uniref:Uncharacterized protein n=1 Tax=Sciurus vulgaris TaxID=55149 RepID=A0A8D2D7U8_SCIVU